MRAAACACVLLALLLGVSSPSLVSGQDFPPGFTAEPVFGELNAPSSVKFIAGDANGAAFILERAGILIYYASLADTAGTLVYDFQRVTMNFLDTAALGLAVHPNFAQGTRLVYVSYAVDSPLGGTIPTYNDNCADAVNQGCQCEGGSCACKNRVAIVFCLY